MNRILENQIKAIRYAIAIVNDKFKLTESAKVSNNGERLLLKDWQEARNNCDFTIFAHTQRYKWVLPLLQGLKVLDVGCGSGYGTHYLAQNGISEIIGVDLSIDAIKFADKQYKMENCKFKPMNALNLEFCDQSFDAVISFDVLEHIDESKQYVFISEIARVLCGDGLAIIGCPNASTSIANNRFHLKELTLQEFETLLQGYFREMKLLGQDLLVDGVRQKTSWYKCLSSVNHFEGVITDENVTQTYGLLAICKSPKTIKA